MNEPPILSHHPPKNWWDRNWKWFLPSVCLTSLVSAGAAITSFAALIFGLTKSSDVYQQALAQAQADPAVIEALGSPITPGFLVSGHVNVNGASGKADLAIPIEGPKGSATVFVAASKSQGLWEFDDLAVEVKATHKRIDLLAPPPDTAPAPEPPPPPDNEPPSPPDSMQI